MILNLCDRSVMIGTYATFAPAGVHFDVIHAPFSHSLRVQFKIVQAARIAGTRISSKVEVDAK